MIMEFADDFFYMIEISLWLPGILFIHEYKEFIMENFCKLVIICA